MPRHERELKVARHDADHHVGLPVQQHLRTQHAWIAMETLLPQRIAEERHRLFLIILLLRKESPHKRGDLERWEYSARKPGSQHLVGLANTGQLKIRLAKSAQAFEAMRIA